MARVAGVPPLTEPDDPPPESELMVVFNKVPAELETKLPCPPVTGFTSDDSIILAKLRSNYTKMYVL